MVSVLPRAEFPHNSPDTHMKLEAVNDMKLTTYGTATIWLNIENMPYEYPAIIADVKEAIIGWDLMHSHKLSLWWNKGSQLELWDSRQNVKALTKILPKDQKSHLAGLKIAMVNPATDTVDKPFNVTGEIFKSYQQSAQKQSAIDSKNTPMEPVPFEFQQLLNEFPSILKPDFKPNEARHKVLHHIDTGNAKTSQATHALVISFILRMASEHGAGQPASDPMCSVQIGLSTTIIACVLELPSNTKGQPRCVNRQVWFQTHT